MASVVIQRCRFCGTVHEHAIRVAEALEQELSVKAQVINGEPGEFTILYNGNVVLRKGLNLPEIIDVVEAVRTAELLASEPRDKS